jgi:transposase
MNFSTKNSNDAEQTKRYADKLVKFDLSSKAFVGSRREDQAQKEDAEFADEMLTAYGIRIFTINLGPSDQFGNFV